MKNISLILIGLSLIYCVGCRMSTDEWATLLKPEIESKIQPTFDKNFVADKLTIAQTDGNNYEGIMKSKINDTLITYKVKIIYDGENAYYKVKPNLNSMFNY